MSNVIDVLEERGFIAATTSEELRSRANQPMAVYCGFDPTGDSLHVGNLVAIMGLAWFQRFGHQPVAIVGGATALIGDPSGKSQERPQLSFEDVAKNIVGIQRNLETILDFDCPENPAQLLNNYDWHQGYSFIDFLSKAGRHFRVGSMLAKEAVRTRLQSDEGISFTEFSYQVLQGYDFLHLYENYQVEVQLGGSDQWGNITAGTDLIRKVHGTSAHGITFPLLTRSDGKKFGKSEGGAIWLSPDRLSPYQFYQYFIRMPDADVIKLLKMLTFLEMDEINTLAESMKAPNYTPNHVQKRLAEEVTRLVHGEKGLQAALKVTNSINPGAETALDAETLEALAADMPSCTLKKSDVIGLKLIDILVSTELCSSKGQARRLIENGGAYVNNTKINEMSFAVEAKDLIDDRLLLLAAGKKNKKLVRVID